MRLAVTNPLRRHRPGWLPFIGVGTICGRCQERPASHQALWEDPASLPVSNAARVCDVCARELVRRFGATIKPPLEEA